MPMRRKGPRKKLGIEHLKSFATRGVVLDLVRVYKEAGKLKKNPNCKGDCLEGGTVISEDDLKAALKRSAEIH